MSVYIETSAGDLVVDLFTDDCPLACKNFIKLCKCDPLTSVSQFQKFMFLAHIRKPPLSNAVLRPRLSSAASCKSAEHILSVHEGDGLSNSAVHT